MTGKLSAAQLAERLPDEADDGPTQLADRYPQIDAPLRVEPPPSMKAPARNDAPSRDAHIRRSAFAPAHPNDPSPRRPSMTQPSAMAGAPPPYQTRKTLMSR